jgi:hypothetical protein
MKSPLRPGVVAGVLALVAGFVGTARADDKPQNPAEAPPVKADVRVDANTRPDFSGKWTLNEDLSEGLRIRAARGRRGGRAEERAEGARRRVVGVAASPAISGVRATAAAFFATCRL